MRRPRYPLETLAEHRDRRVDDAVRGLAQAIRARETAEDARRRAENEREGHDARVCRTVAEEQTALERGELAASDLAHAHAWRVREDAERAALAEQVERAGRAEDQARTGEQGARDAVVVRRAEAEVVIQDRERWTAAARKRADAKEEEDAAEAFRPKR